MTLQNKTFMYMYSIFVYKCACTCNSGSACTNSMRVHLYEKWWYMYYMLVLIDRNPYCNTWRSYRYIYIQNINYKDEEVIYTNIFINLILQNGHIIITNQTVINKMFVYIIQLILLISSLPPLTSCLPEEQASDNPVSLVLSVCASISASCSNNIATVIACPALAANISGVQPIGMCVVIYIQYNIIMSRYILYVCIE